MNLIQLSHRNPTATIVVFLIACILGVAALVRMPAQLTPNLERPMISILNVWRAAAPEDLESEIVEPTERVLRPHQLGNCGTKWPIFMRNVSGHPNKFLYGC